MAAGLGWQVKEKWEDARLKIAYWVRLAQRVCREDELDSSAGCANEVDSYWLTGSSHTSEAVRYDWTRLAGTRTPDRPSPTEPK